MTTDITDFLAEQKRLADAATPGPWDNYSPNPKITPEQAIYSHWLESIPEARSSEIAALMTPKDAEFIAAARESVPRMIAVIEAVMVIVEGLRFTGPPDTPKTATHHVLDGLYRDLNRAIEAALGGEGDATAGR